MFGLFGKKPTQHEARISPAGVSVTVPLGDNLLKAALAAGLPWPHDCRVGSCGTCKCKLVSGKIKPLSDFSYVLSGEEMASGTVLACQTSLRSNVEIEIDLDEAASMPQCGANTIDGTIYGLEELTHDILRVEVELDAPLVAMGGTNGEEYGYLPGQYADLKIAGIDKPRSYSFACPPSPGQKRLEFFIRKVPGGELSTWLFERSRLRADVSITGPYGAFYLRPGDGPILCVAGGSGMSAIKAILEGAANKLCKRDVVFIFGAREQRDLYCTNEMAALASRWRENGGQFRFVPVLSEEPPASEWKGERGLCTDVIPDQPIDFAETQAYLCGPPGMIDAAVDVLNGNGVRKEAIFFDKFLDASSIPGGRK